VFEGLHDIAVASTPRPSKGLGSLSPMRLTRRVFLLQAWVAALLILGAGTAVLILKGLVPHPVSDIADTVGVVLVTTGLVGLVYEMWIRNSARDDTLAIVRLAESVDRAGIVIVSRWDRVELKEFLTSGGDVAVFVTYGQTVANNYADQVMEYAAREKRKVTISTLDPEISPELLGLYAAKFEISVETLRNRIVEARNVWTQRAIHHNATQRLTIENIRVILPFTFYIAGKEMWVVMTVAHQGRDPSKIPAIKCRQVGTDEGLFNWITRDIGQCRRQGLIVTV
jgi:hypothetical protein